MWPERRSRVAADAEFGWRHILVAEFPNMQGARATECAPGVIGRLVGPGPVPTTNIAQGGQISRGGAKEKG